MKNLEIIQITKEYTEKEVVDAIAAYMAPHDSKEPMSIEQEGNAYTIKTIAQTINKDGTTAVIVTHMVKLIFDKNVCRVVFNDGRNTSESKVLGGGIIAGGMLGLLGGPLGAIPGMAVGAFVGNGYLSHNFKVQRKEIIAILETYLCENVN